MTSNPFSMPPTRRWRYPAIVPVALSRMKHLQIRVRIPLLKLSPIISKPGSGLWRASFADLNNGLCGEFQGTRL